MDRYVTGAMIRRLREEKNMTQAEFAQQLSVSDKAVSKWETGRGYPDISLMESLASALGISVTELLSGEDISNTNRSFNMLKARLYICPVCGNVIHASGEAVISCCGITLPPLEAEPEDSSHHLDISIAEDEYYVTLNHEMHKNHFITFLMAASDEGFQLVKLYPEGPAEARFKISRTKYIYFHCNHHGLFRKKVSRKLIRP